MQAEALVPLNVELNSLCLLPALFGAHHILHGSRIRVNIKKKYIGVTFKLLDFGKVLGQRGGGEEILALI